MSDLRPVSLDDLTLEQLRELDQRTEYWRKKFQPLIDAVRESERITAEDLAIIINCRDDDKV